MKKNKKQDFFNSEFGKKLELLGTNEEWYNVAFDKVKKEATINIFGVIGGASWMDDTVPAKRFISELNDLDANIITIYVNSPGGSVAEGFAIYNALNMSKAKIITHNIGMAASAAAYVMMAGDEIVTANNAWMMIHSPWSFLVGNSKELRKAADVLDGLNKSMISIFASRTGLETDKIETMLDEETWISAEQGIKDGFYDTVVEDKIKNLNFDLSAFDCIPEDVKILNSQNKRDGEQSLRDAGYSRSEAMAVRDVPAELAMLNELKQTIENNTIIVKG